MSIAITTSHDTGQHTTSRSTTQPNNTPLNRTTPNAANRPVADAAVPGPTSASAAPYVAITVATGLPRAVPSVTAATASVSSMTMSGCVMNRSSGNAAAERSVARSGRHR